MNSPDTVNEDCTTSKKTKSSASKSVGRAGAGAPGTPSTSAAARPITRIPAASARRPAVGKGSAQVPQHIAAQQGSNLAQPHSQVVEKCRILDAIIALAQVTEDRPKRAAGLLVEQQQRRQSGCKKSGCDQRRSQPVLVTALREAPTEVGFRQSAEQPSGQRHDQHCPQYPDEEQLGPQAETRQEGHEIEVARRAPCAASANRPTPWQPPASRPRW